MQPVYSVEYEKGQNDGVFVTCVDCSGVWIRLFIGAILFLDLFWLEFTFMNTPSL